jgi:glutamyl/glutaminyl-tRNA synthetase
MERARAAGGRLLLRNDDLDRGRCRPEFVDAMLEDLRWLGVTWDGGLISQSGRIAHYRRALEKLHAAGLIFACTKSRRDVQEAAGAPHEGEGPDDEPVYPRKFRPAPNAPLPPLDRPVTVNWRFRVPDGEAIAFTDAAAGEQRAVAGRDFGDFLVWRKDDTPSYQLATTVDDAELGITEVVRGADLIKSTFRQLLLFRALRWALPQYYHAPLMLDEHGRRLAKRHDTLALRTLRSRGESPESVRKLFADG